MNVYDFDKTIYDGDSTVHFFFYCLKKYPAVWLSLPRTGIAAIPFGLKMLPKTRFKEIFYRFLRSIPDVESAVADFWVSHEGNIMEWYGEAKKEDDLIISASPEFLLRPICKKLGVRVIASRIDTATGRCTGENCWGPEKVKRMYEAYPDAEIDEFSSDSYSDQPLADLAAKSYLVVNRKRVDWNENK